MAGVGQRMITGVAKRMAGQFFKAIDDELTGAVVPIGAAPSRCCRRHAGRRARGGRCRGPRCSPAGQPQRPRRCGGDVQSLLLGAAGGALLTLIGVLVGYRLGRRR